MTVVEFNYCVVSINILSPYLFITSCIQIYTKILPEFASMLKKPNDIL